METECRQENRPWIISNLVVSDVEKAAELYKTVFDFKILELNKSPDGDVWHAELSYHDQMIMIAKEGEYEGVKYQSPKSLGVNSPMSLYVYCENVDNFYQHAIQHGVKGLNEPTDAFWGDRYCRIEDIDGYVWCVGTQIKG